MLENSARNSTIEASIGASLKELRVQRGLSARWVASQAGISAAMVSRIENGLVSPSITTLEALAAALEVPIISLFREARTEHTDFTIVRAGEGLKSTRITDDHQHEYVNLAMHARRDLRFQARYVTLLKDGGQPPNYTGQGVVFVFVFKGEAIYRYGRQRFTLREGDSISVDSELNHGFVDVLSDRFEFLTVQAERP
ncbi:helix-turn-helix domain-containing protein [Rhodophyticola sp. CCM32]|uniref:helix-turn-helix domain-containing protein n=1 Tax=Rhodophyticola sp. CCM32 TaxID=2916397 RepID=UPI00107F1B10|nr:helix-turn-helix transcriptional regulator [Rhodophyticola sp. CCM32]QBY01374.1 helix-turn-helix domain-containing protein [Rhodophyticola sp. CCM32]